SSSVASNTPPPTTDAAEPEVAPAITQDQSTQPALLVQEATVAPIQEPTEITTAVTPLPPVTPNLVTAEPVLSTEAFPALPEKKVSAAAIPQQIPRVKLPTRTFTNI